LRYTDSRPWAGTLSGISINVFCDVIDQRVLLAILCSTLLRYFAKAFINHGVVAQPSDLPIVLPHEAESKAILAIVDDIIAAQKADAAFDYRPKLAKLDALIAQIYGLTQAESEEISTWYRRHYPRLTGAGTEEE
jgi:hypothetical protein